MDVGLDLEEVLDHVFKTVLRLVLARNLESRCKDSVMYHRLSLLPLEPYLQQRMLNRELCE